MILFFTKAIKIEAIQSNKGISKIKFHLCFVNYEVMRRTLLFSAQSALISEVFLGVGKVKGWTLSRMQGSDYRFNFSVSRRRLRVCDIIHSDNVSHLHRFSAVRVIHRGCRRERVWTLSYQWTVEGGLKTTQWWKTAIFDDIMTISEMNILGLTLIT